MQERSGSYLLSRLYYTTP